MKFLHSATVVFSSLVLAAAVARAEQFKANHMFISCSNNGNIVEFDENGQFVRSFAPPGLNQPQSLAFGANGLLYVTSFSTNELFEILPSGLVSNKFSLGPNVGPNAVRVGPEGLLYINGSLDHKMHRFEVMGSTPHAIGSIPLTTQSLVDFEFTSAGTIVGVSTSPSILYEVNLLGNQLRSKDISSTPFPFGIAIGPFDLVWYGSLGGNTLSRSTASLQVLDTFPVADLGNPTGMVCAPNGDLFVCSNANDRVIRFDTETFQPKGAIGFNVPALDGPFGIAFAPYRFEATIKGTRGGDDEGTQSVEEHAFLSVAPGSRTIMVQFEKDTTSDGIANLFFENAMYFHGSETGAPSSKRILNGIELGINAAGGSGRIDLEVKVSTEGSLGFLKVKKASGRIARSVAGGSFFAEIKSGKLVN